MDVVAAAPAEACPPAPPAAAAAPFKIERAILETIPTAIGHTRGAADKARYAARIRQFLLHHVDDTADRIRSVQHARRPPDRLDPLGRRRFDVWAVFVAPLLRLKPLSVVEHE